MTATQVALGVLIGAGVGAALVPMTRRSMNGQAAVGALLPVSALLTAVSWGLLAWRFPAWPALFVYGAFATLAVPLAIVDAIEYRLPTLLVRTAYAAAIGSSLIVIATEEDVGRLLRATLGMAGLLLVYLMVALAFPNDLGAGDVRLAGVIGWVLAWDSYPTLLTGAVLSAVIGGVVGIAALVARRTPRPGQVPAGPTMLLGSFVALLLAA
ncbi:MAG: hypothetical protein ACRDTB_25075 [Actinophytocola sp.]